MYRYISDPKTLHQALTRNGYLCPALKSKLMSFDFMKGVFMETNWLPKMTSCKVFAIASVPPIDILSDILAAEIVDHVNQAANLTSK